MQVLKYIEKYDFPIPPIGNQINPGGSNGEIYELANESNKVIKLGICFDFGSIENYFEQMSKTLHYVMDINPSVYVKIYDFKCVGSIYRDWFTSNKIRKQKCILYYYIMDKLYSLLEYEKNIFNNIIKNKLYSIQNHLSRKEVKSNNKFNSNKIVDFWNKIRTYDILYTDIHIGNIMKDNFGNYKLIDLDEESLKERN